MNIDKYRNNLETRLQSLETETDKLAESLDSALAFIRSLIGPSIPPELEEDAVSEKMLYIIAAYNKGNKNLREFISMLGRVSE